MTIILHQSSMKNIQMLLPLFQVNIDSKVGAVGFTTRIIPSLYPITLIKVDKHTGEPLRDRLGLCVKCEPGRMCTGSVHLVYIQTCTRSDLCAQYLWDVHRCTAKSKVALFIESKFGMVWLCFIQRCQSSFCFSVQFCEVSGNTYIHVLYFSDLFYSTGEQGELVGKIVKGDPLREFNGYVSKESTSKKICHDVFKKGDAAFMTGKYLPEIYLLIKELSI